MMHTNQKPSLKTEFFQREPALGWNTNRGMCQIHYVLSPKNGTLTLGAITINAEFDNVFDIIFHKITNLSLLVNIIKSTDCHIDQILQNSEHFRVIIAGKNIASLLDKLNQNGYLPDTVTADIHLAVSDNFLNLRSQQKHEREAAQAKEKVEFENLYGAQIKKEKEQQELIKSKLNSLVKELLFNPANTVSIQQVKNLTPVEKRDLSFAVGERLEREVPKSALFDESSSTHYLNKIQKFKEIASVLKDLQVPPSNFIFGNLGEEIALKESEIKAAIKTNQLATSAKISVADNKSSIFNQKERTLPYEPSTNYALKR